MPFVLEFYLASKSETVENAWLFSVRYAWMFSGLMLWAFAGVPAASSFVVVGI